MRAPDTFTLIIVWPIMAQPPMPPKKPVTMLATPWPQASRVLSEWVSVMSSTSFAVISDSSRPTSAMASAYGAMMLQGVQVSGTSGRTRVGQAVRQLALVADGRHRDAGDDVNDGEQRRSRPAGRGSPW